MQIQPQVNCKVLYDHQELNGTFPINHPGSSSYSPPAGPVSFMHYHRSLELGYCYKGCGIFFVDGRVLPFSAGSSSVIFADQIHIAQSDSRDPSEWKFIHLEPLRLLSGFELAELEPLAVILKNTCNNRNIFDRDSTKISNLICQIIMELENRKPSYRSMVKALVFELFITLSRECTEPGDSVRQRAVGSITEIAPALKYISDNYTSQFSLDVLPQLCNTSMTSFRRLFRETMGMSPRDYLHLVRIKMASILLLNSMDSILDISLKVGYPTLSSFNRQFGRIMKMPPSKWRKI